MPSFEKDGLVCGMAAFKAHATFGFWKGAQLDDPHGLLRAKGTASFMAEKIVEVFQQPPDRILADYVRRAVELNRKIAAGEGPKKTPRKKRPEARVPPNLHREYIEWIVEARKDETRDKRLATAIEWLEHGKSRNWKYEKR